ncbi:MAG: hypothetical protein O3A01_07195 [bacterium]|nr:hypothetical protein [bacterium]
MARETMDQFISGVMVGVLVVFVGVVIYVVFTNIQRVELRLAKPILMDSSSYESLGAVTQKTDKVRKDNLERSKAILMRSHPRSN